MKRNKIIIFIILLVGGFFVVSKFLSAQGTKLVKKENDVSADTDDPKNTVIKIAQKLIDKAKDASSKGDNLTGYTGAASGSVILGAALFAFNVLAETFNPSWKRDPLYLAIEAKMKALKDEGYQFVKTISKTSLKAST